MPPPGAPEEVLLPGAPADSPAEGICPPDWPDDPPAGGKDAELPPEDPLEDGGELPPEDPPTGGNGEELPVEPLLPDELGDCMLLELHAAKNRGTVKTTIISEQ